MTSTSTTRKNGRTVRMVRNTAPIGPLPAGSLLTNEGDRVRFYPVRPLKQDDESLFWLSDGFIDGCFFKDASVRLWTEQLFENVTENPID